MKRQYPMQVALTDLRLADTVKVFEGPFGFAIVTQITADAVIMTRAYGTTSDFSTTAGVIFYTGQEVCTYLKSDTRFPEGFEVWDRRTVR